MHSCKFVFQNCVCVDIKKPRSQLFSLWIVADQKHLVFDFFEKLTSTRLHFIAQKKEKK